MKSGGSYHQNRRIIFSKWLKIYQKLEKYREVAYFSLIFLILKANYLIFAESDFGNVLYASKHLGNIQVRRNSNVVWIICMRVRIHCVIWRRPFSHHLPFFRKSLLNPLLWGDFKFSFWQKYNTILRMNFQAYLHNYGDSRGRLVSVKNKT